VSDYPPNPRRPDESDDLWASGDAHDDPAEQMWEDPRRAASRQPNPAELGPVLRPLTRGTAYHRQQARRGEYAEYFDPPPVPPAPPPPARAGLPFWAAFVLVILGLLAFLAFMLACAALLAL